RMARIFSWGVHDPGADSATAATAMRARAYALLLVTASALVLVTLTFPNNTGRHVSGLAVPAIVALGAALVIAVRREHCSERLLDWLTPLATALTSIVVA